MLSAKSIFIFISIKFLISLSFASDSITIIPGPTYKVGTIHHLIFGKHYRNLWSVPVKMEILNLDQEAGGLVPQQLGGSNQTTNLRLVNNNNEEYVLRLIVKDPSRSFAPIVRSSFVGKLMVDQNSAENPYAALVIPYLAEASGIYYTKPKLVYIPHDVKLREFNSIVANSVALLEERPNGDQSDDKNFGNAPLVVSTKTMLENIHKSNNYSVDQEMFLRCRLFDMLISDWGRHEDQWRWGQYTINNKIVYRPIPRDRDHAFYRFNDGLLPYIVAHFVNPKLQTFGKDYSNIEGLNQSGRYLDERLLNNLSLEQWLTTARELQQSLSDSVIQSAIKKWPPEVYKEVGVYTAERLIARRNKLVDAAFKAYKLLAKEVIIPGSDDMEIVKADRVSKTQTSIVVLKAINEKEFSDTLYRRIFNHKETKAITIYGLGAADVFIAEGKSRKNTTVRFIGGDGQDIYVDNSLHRGLSPLIMILDSKEGSKLLSDNNKTKVVFIDQSLNFTYDRKGFKRAHTKKVKARSNT